MTIEVADGLAVVEYDGLFVGHLAERYLGHGCLRLGCWLKRCAAALSPAAGRFTPLNFTLRLLCGDGMGVLRHGDMKKPVPPRGERAEGRKRMEG